MPGNEIVPTAGGRRDACSRNPKTARVPAPATGTTCSADVARVRTAANDGASRSENPPWSSFREAVAVREVRPEARAEGIRQGLADGPASNAKPLGTAPRASRQYRATTRRKMLWWSVTANVASRCRLGVTFSSRTAAMDRRYVSKPSGDEWRESDAIAVSAARRRRSPGGPGRRSCATGPKADRAGGTSMRPPRPAPGRGASSRGANGPARKGLRSPRRAARGRSASIRRSTAPVKPA